MDAILRGFLRELYGDSMGFQGLLEGLHKDGFHKIVIMILRGFYKDSASIAIGTHEPVFWISQMRIPSPLVCNSFTLVFIVFYRFPLMFHGFNTSVSPESSCCNLDGIFFDLCACFATVISARKEL